MKKEEQGREKSPRKFNRKKFLQYGVATVGGAMLLPYCKKEPEGPENEYVSEDLRELSDSLLNMYRGEFSDTRGGTHGFSPHCVNCKGNCAWQVFEHQGVITREEQVAGYPPIAPNIPDANPRGCNKGGIHSSSLNEEDRLLYPMRRTGKRGEGKFERISWDEALNEIAEKVVEVGGAGEFENIMVYAGTGILSPVRRAAALRLGSLLGAIRFNVASAIGDMFPGASIAYGVSAIGCSSEAWYEADYLMLWGINPTVTRIPDAHYVWEGKYRGARVVTVSPEFNPSARQSSLWMPVKSGADSFLAASMAHVIIKEKLYKEDFMREQTDLPFLVKVSDGKLLHESDLLPGGSDEACYFFDTKTVQPVKARGTKDSDESTLNLGDVIPALEGRFTIQDARGRSIVVTTVFEKIKEELKQFSPEKTQKETGLHPDMVYGEARRLAAAKVAIIMQGYRIHKYFWGTLTMWGAALLLALTGHAGRRGGLDIDNEWKGADVSQLASPKPARMSSGFLGEWNDAKLHRSFDSHFNDSELKRKVGLTKNQIKREAKRAVDEYKFKYYGKPRLMLLMHDNRFVRNVAQKQSEKEVLRGVELLVNINYRLDSTALLADIVLPATTNYESYELRFDPGYSRFANLMRPPEGYQRPGEVKSEWEIVAALTEKVQKLAQERGIGEKLDTEFDVKRNLSQLHDDFINLGENRLENEKDVLEWMIGNMAAFNKRDLKKAWRDGYLVPGKAAGQTSPLYPDRPYYSFENQIELKHTYFTTSGRQQFYVDHPLYLKLGVNLPTARSAVRPRKYPLAYLTPHTRYGIHTTWRTNKYHLRLQRGEPLVNINPETARSKGIRDGDYALVYNDVGEMKVRVKVAGGTPPGAVVMEHAWDNIQFEGRKGYNNVVPGVLTPMELIGNHGHLSFGSFWDGNQLKSEVSVDIKRV